MSISLYNIRKWYHMLNNTSIYHVNQGEGRCFSSEYIRGYYNDLTEKVSDKQILDNFGIPLLNYLEKKKVYFPTMIFQYGLGAYDKYLLSDKKNSLMLQKMLNCSNWALKNQNIDGSWDNFNHIHPENTYSSMSQGEGVSLLLRAYIETNDLKYKKSAEKAMNFMILDIKKGGTALYKDSEIYFYEYTHLPVVLNGWIFSLFGLFDYILLTKDKKMEEIYKKSLLTLEKKMHEFDNGYWSKYDNEKKIASPFYHSVHIAQLRVLYKITKINTFNEYAIKWEKYSNKKFCRYKAFLRKTLQKIIEKEE